MGATQSSAEPKLGFLIAPGASCEVAQQTIGPARSHFAAPTTPARETILAAVGAFTDCLFHKDRVPQIT